MKNLLLGTLLTCAAAGPVLAADLPAKTYRPPEVLSWSGFYVGGHVGYGWSSKEWRLIDIGGSGAPFNLGSDNIGGAVGGAQIGVNWQSGPVVLGLEADFDWADISGQTCNLSVADVAFLCTSKGDHFGTVTGRIGAAFGQALFYTKAGGAWVRDTHSLSVIPSAVEVFEGTSRKTKWGWTAGAGVEYAITRNWSAKIEYDVLLFDTERYVFTLTSGGEPVPVRTDIKQGVHVVKLGWNYRFDWGGPLIARY